MAADLPEPLADKAGLPPTKVRGKPKPLLLLIAAVIGGAGYFAWKHFTPTVNPDILTLSGRIEADETDIGAKTGGRLVAIRVKEGDAVKQGQVVAEIADEEVPEQLLAAKAQVAAAQQEVQQVKSEIDINTVRLRKKRKLFQRENAGFRI